MIQKCLNGIKFVKILIYLSKKFIESIRQMYAKTLNSFKYIMAY